MLGPIGTIGGPFTIVLANPNGTDADPAHPQTYQIGFPTQTLSGNYSLTLASTIKSKLGDAAGYRSERRSRCARDISDTTTTVTSTSTDVPKAIGGKVAESVINITDPFLIQSITLTMNLTYPNDPNLSAVLIAPDGTQVPLFTNVGQVGSSKANFQNTVFDDSASTPIQNGAAPFFGKFNPQEPLGALVTKGELSSGTWILEITSTGVSTGSLTSWSLSLGKPVPSTGLGESGADQTSAHFRIFTMDVSNPQSSDTWTPVGGASNNETGNAGRISGIAVDPSDPSGNTVYAASGSGGIWKTRDFLTTDPAGPTWVPITDFGPTFGLNIGSIAVFPKNKDTNQSIVFVGTGEGDTLGTANPNAAPMLSSQGVGFLRSFDGGATWTLLDSSTNVDAQGNTLPMNSPSRDHIFVGTSAFKVIVDPQPTPSGEEIVYAAVSGGTNGGLWRSLDSGKHWTKMRAGNATDVVFDYKSGFFDALNNPTGNLQYIYGAFQGDGVYFSPNRGQVWNELLGNIGDPLIRDDTNSPTAVNVTWHRRVRTAATDASFWPSRASPAIHWTTCNTRVGCTHWSPTRLVRFRASISPRTSARPGRTFKFRSLRCRTSATRATTQACPMIRSSRRRATMT